MSAESELDIRWPIGLLFSLLGVLLALFGLISPVRAQYHPLDAGAVRMINLNLWWGLVMLIFGLWMVLGAVRSDRSAS
jgi:hypothetical protein